MQIKSDRIVFPDNTEQFTASSDSGETATLESLGIPNHENVTVNASGDVTANSFNGSHMGDGSALTGIQAGTWEKIASSATASGALSTVIFNGFTGYRYVKVYCSLRSFTSSSSNRQPSIRFINTENQSITTPNYWGAINGLNNTGANMPTNTGNAGDYGKIVLDSESQLPVNSPIGTQCEFYFRVGQYPMIQYNITNFTQWNQTTGTGYGKVNGFIGHNTTANCNGFQFYDRQGHTVGYLDYYVEGLKL